MLWFFKKELWIRLTHRFEQLLGRCFMSQGRCSWLVNNSSVQSGLSIKSNFSFIFTIQPIRLGVSGCHFFYCFSPFTLHLSFLLVLARTWHFPKCSRILKMVKYSCMEQLLLGGLWLITPSLKVEFTQISNNWELFRLTSMEKCFGGDGESRRIRHHEVPRA